MVGWKQSALYVDRILEALASSSYVVSLKSYQLEIQV